MKLNRETQKEILQRAADAYPGPLFFHGEEQRDAGLVANACYLHGHGLLKCTIMRESGIPIVVAAVEITEKGIDFMADDGGLSAILGTVTIRLHEKSLLQLLEMRIQAAPAAPEQKSELIHQLRALPGEAIKHLTMKLLDMSLEATPNAFQLLQTALRAAL